MSFINGFGFKKAFGILSVLGLMLLLNVSG